MKMRNVSSILRSMANGKRFEGWTSDFRTTRSSTLEVSDLLPPFEELFWLTSRTACGLSMSDAEEQQLIELWEDFIVLTPEDWRSTLLDIFISGCTPVLCVMMQLDPAPEFIPDCGLRATDLWCWRTRAGIKRKIVLHHVVAWRFSISWIRFKISMRFKIRCVRILAVIPTAHTLAKI